MTTINDYEMTAREVASATKTASRVYSALLRAEVNSRYARDCIRLMSEERVALGFALASKDGVRIVKTTAEAVRVATMWGVEV